MITDLINGVRKVTHGVRKVIQHPSSLDILIIFKGQSNIRTVATVTHKQTTKQPTNHANIEPSRFSDQWLDWGVCQIWSSAINQ
jgi:hypothetical protein